MKVFTERHANALKELEIDEFVEKMLEDMIDLDFKPSYPSNSEEYENFIKAGIIEAKKYDLTTQKNCHAFIMAWHVLGKKILEISWLMDMLNSDETFPEEKREALLHASWEKLGKEK